MDRIVVDDPVWFNALSLGERAASLQTACNGGVDLEADTALAEKRILRWRSLAEFASQEHFDKRLTQDSIDPRALRRLLGESVQSLRLRVSETPAWLETLLIAFSRTENLKDGASEPLPAERMQKLGFLVGIEPLIKAGVKRLRRGIKALEKEHSYVPFDAGTIEHVMIAGLPQQVVKLMARTMVLELNVARIQELLRGDTAEARYLSFIETLRDPAAMLAILREYPVLSRQVVACIDNWTHASIEFLARLSRDWEMICAELNGGADPGRLTQVAASAGDLHRGGRSVIIVTFGSGWKLVYKPRSLAVDVHFRKLLTKLNEWGEHAPFRAPVAIDRSNYGWAEFVEARPCDSLEEAKRFYERQGGYLALLYFLEATDFHLENLIAAGEHPVLVDLEALFHPRLGFGGAQSMSSLVAEEVMARSVLRVGLLPQRIWAAAGKSGVDISGLGGEPGQLSPHLVPVFDGAGTDEMKVVRKQVAMPGSKNRPSVAGSAINPQDFVDSILKGFTSIYELVVKRRRELLADDGPIAAFACDEVRVVLRPTRTYALLLSESCHPDVLRLGFERDFLFDRLWREVEMRPKMAELIPAETADLRRGDVPVFTTRPNSTDLLTSIGDRIDSFFEASSLATVRDRIGEACDSDLSRQSWFIGASMASLTVEHDSSRDAQSQNRLADLPAASPDDFIAAAAAIGDRLEMLAISQRDDVAWIGLVLVDGNSWSLLPLSFDLYGGTLGILLFLAYLGQATDQERYTALAGRALSSVLKRLDSAQPSGPEPASMGGSIGAFSGWGGIIYTLAHVGVLWNDAELLSRAESLVKPLAPQVEQDQGLDIIGGSAGLIGALSALYQATASGPALELVKSCAVHLVAAARAMDTGIAWETPVDATQPLTGFSHGAAGFAWALQEAAWLTGDRRFLDAALDAVAYERSVFSREAGNWPDFRSNGATALAAPAFSTTWCHGAPGIALARLMSLQHFDDRGMQADADIALTSTARAGFGMNHSLCHGDLGNIEPLLVASQMENGGRWKTLASAISSSILETIQSGGWLCGVPQGVETPGLLVGLAGIGYGLLRLADPAGIPSVLALAPPRK